MSFKIKFSLMLAILFWSSAYVGIRAVLTDYSPEGLAALRYLVASFCMGIFYLESKRRPSVSRSKIALKDKVYLMLLGMFAIGVYNIALNYGELKLASIWLPANRFATVAGLTTAIGMATGALAQKYLTQLVQILGYQQALHSALIAGIVLCIVLVFFTKNQPRHNKALAKVTLLQDQINPPLVQTLKFIFTNPQMWLIGIIGCLLYLPSSVFLDLWGIPYLKSVYHLSSKQAVAIANYTFYGWIIAGPLIGAFSDKIKKRCIPLMVTGFFAASLLMVVFYLPNIAVSHLYLMFFGIGFCCGSHPLCFALGKENNPLIISGSAVAITNMLIMAGGAIFQPLVGLLLDLHTSGALDTRGLPIYQSGDYSFALSIVPIGVMLGIFLSLFLKETHCEIKSASGEMTATGNKLFLSPMKNNDSCLSKSSLHKAGSKV